MNILIVEDHKELVDSISEYLQGENYNCDYATSIKDAKEKIKDKEYVCYIIDLGLPDGNGMELVNYLKSKDTDSAILILSAKDTVDNKIEALKTGADDYVTKPFNLSELNARVTSILRRRKLIGMNEIICKEIRINPEVFEVFVNQQSIRLTKKEYDLLLFLINNKNKVVTKQSIIEHLWNGFRTNSSSDFLYTHIKNLRKKLVAAGSGDYIQNVNRIGYRFQTN